MQFVYIYFQRGTEEQKYCNHKLSEKHRFTSITADCKAFRKAQKGIDDRARCSASGSQAGCPCYGRPLPAPPADFSAARVCSFFTFTFRGEQKGNNNGIKSFQRSTGQPDGCPCYDRIGLIIDRAPLPTDGEGEDLKEEPQTQRAGLRHLPRFLANDRPRAENRANIEVKRVIYITSFIYCNAIIGMIHWQPQYLKGFCSRC